MATQEFEGTLEIDNDKGVIQFYSSETGAVLLRILNLPTPIPIVSETDGLDLTHFCKWSKKVRKINNSQRKEG